MGKDYDAKSDYLSDLSPHEAHCYSLGNKKGQEELSYLAVEELGY
jgi:hypothetical protein